MTTIQQLPPLDPARAALLISDMQRGFIEPGGSISRLGLPVDRTSRPIEPIRRLIAAFREAGAPIVYTQMWLRPDYADAGILATVFPPLQSLGHMVAGSRDAEIVDALAPWPDDYVIRKTRWNAFHGTPLELSLRTRGVDTIVLTGIATNVCVESTAREAFTRDFRVLVPTDATASYTQELEESSLASMAFGCAKLVTTEQVLEALGVMALS